MEVSCERVASAQMSCPHIIPLVPLNRPFLQVCINPARNLVGRLHVCLCEVEQQSLLEFSLGVWLHQPPHLTSQ